MKQLSFSSTRHLWPLLALSAVAFVFFWQYFLLDQTLYAGDTAFVFFPFRHYAIQSLMQGKIPLWNPYLLGGSPGMAEPTYQVFYWPNLLYWITGVQRGIGWTLPLHLLWLSVGVYLLARRSFQLGRLEALVAAIAFSYGGSVQGRLGIPVYTQAASWIPWILLGYDAARQRGGLTLIWAGLALAMQLLAAAPPYTFYTLILLFAFHLFRITDKTETNPEKPQKRAWAALGATLIFGIFLTAAQLLPTWELAGLSDRGTHASYDYATWGSLAPAHLVTMVLPKFYGLYSTITRDSFYPSTELGYVGILSLGLASAAWFSERRRLVRFWVLVIVLSVSLALGSYNPFYPLLYKTIPGISTFRTPGCWLLITGFALCMLAAIGLETLRRGAQRVKAAQVSAVLILALAIGSAALLFSSAGADAQRVSQTPGGPWSQILFMLVCVAPLAILAKPQHPSQAQLVRSAFLSIPLLIALDLFMVSQDMEMQQTLSVVALQAPSPTASMLQSQKSGAVAERFWSGSEQVPMEKWIGGETNSPTSALEYRASSAVAIRALMPSCLPAEFETMGLSGAWGGLMPIRRHARPIYAPSTPPDVQRRWLRLLNVRTYLFLRAHNDPQLQLQGTEPLYSYRDPAALPRAFWVPFSRNVHGEDAIDILSQPAFNPHDLVLLEDTEATLTAAPSVMPKSAFDATSTRITTYQNELVQMDVAAPRAGHVVLMDTAYPGWRARVDGQESPLQVANWMGRAVAVPAGNHRVEMNYEPNSLRTGTFLTLLTIGALTAWVVCSLSGRRSTTA